MRTNAFKAIFGLLILLNVTVSAQVQQSGSPFSWSEKDIARFNVPFVVTPVINVDALLAEDAVTATDKEAPYRFGVEHEVAYSQQNSGITHLLEDGTSIWQFGIECPDAKAISFIFSKFNLVKGAQVYIWNADRSSFLGAFTHLNNKEWGTMGTALLHSDRVVVELIEAAQVVGESQLEIGTIVHAYRDILTRAEDVYEEVNRGPFGNSGNCNINVNCPQGADWQTEKKSVGLIVNGGSAQCSGALVNNTAMDGTPYFLTANHCLGGQNNWVFYFNHESSTCNGSTGPINQSISGSSLVASNGGSDFALLLLSETPPTSYNVQYVGWDNSDGAVTSAVGIHHPLGDVKKICFEDNSPNQTSQAGAQVWYINQWEEGVTEGGSSGSPLFNQDHRVIGQLYGGFAACSGSQNNGQADWYGRFGVSWDGNSSSTRLRDWLDPLNTGQTILDGWPVGATVYSYDAVMGGIANVENVVCGNTITPQVSITNLGTTALTSGTIAWTLNGGTQQTQAWSGNLAQYASTSVSLPLMYLINGSNSLEVSFINPNGVTDENPINNTSSLTFTALATPTYNIQLQLILDDYGDETTWELTSQGQTLYTGGPYQGGLDGTEVIVDWCLAEGCYDFTIFDSFGDGICCGWGEGSYTLYNQIGEVFATGGEFQDNETVNFCPQDLSIAKLSTSATFTMYPNPSAGSLNIVSEQKLETIRVFDNVGSLVRMISANNRSQLTLDIAALTAGCYHVQVTDAHGNISHRTLIKE